MCWRRWGSWTVGLHIGYALNDSGQLYGKIGYSRLKLEADVLGLQASESGSGVGFAVGYENGLGENAYARVEFGYADNGEIFGLNFQRRHAGVGLGVRF
ncbi:outer membrane beta-barrel protein [Pontixanthobacter aestiaquae]